MDKKNTKYGVPLTGMLFACLLLFPSRLFCNDSSFKPKDGFVPNEQTAIQIAEAIWLPIYGKRIESEKPFVAKLIGDTLWVVEGTLHFDKGGVAYIEINKSNSCVMKVKHGK
jgi:hypothetical protein